MTEQKQRKDIVLEKLEGTEEEFCFFLDKIIKAAIRMSKRIDYINEELDQLEKVVQITLTDIDLAFWFENKKAEIIYGKGINEAATLKIELTRDSLTKIIKQEISASDAYMRGRIKVNGNITHAINVKTFFRVFLLHLNTLNKKDIEQ